MLVLSLKSSNHSAATFRCFPYTHVGASSTLARPSKSTYEHAVSSIGFLLSSFRRMLTLVNDEGSDRWPKKCRNIDEPRNLARIQLHTATTTPSQPPPIPLTYLPPHPPPPL